MNSQKVTKKALSALLASTLVFSLMPTAAFAAQADTSSSQQKIERVKTQTDKQTRSDKQTQSDKQNNTDKKDAGDKQEQTDEQDKSDKEDKEIDLDFEIKDETQKKDVKERKATEVDKDKFADPNWIQKEVDSLLGAIAFNADPASFIGMYIGGAIQRGLFALGSGLLNNIGSAFFGGPVSGEEMTANKVAFLLTKLDAKAKDVAAESKDLTDLIKTEARGSIIDDFNSHMNKARGLMLALKNQYDDIMCCNDEALKASLVAKMNVQRERAIIDLLTEKAQIDTYILGESSLSGKNIFQVFDSYADTKYSLNGDSYEIKFKFRLHVALFMCNMAKYIAIPEGDTRPISPFAGQLASIKQKDKAVSDVLDVNLPHKVSTTLRFSRINQYAQIAPLYAHGKIDNTLSSEIKGNNENYNKYTTLDLKGFNEDHTAHRYFSKGRTIETFTGLKYYVEFYTAGNRNYLIGESFAQKFITQSEFDDALAKKPKDMKVKDWIERAAGLKKGECPRYIVLDESLTTSCGGAGFFSPLHFFKYSVYDTEKERYNEYHLGINEPWHSSGYWATTWGFVFAGRSGSEKLFTGEGNGKQYRDFIENARILNKIDASTAKAQEEKEAEARKSQNTNQSTQADKLKTYGKTKINRNDAKKILEDMKLNKQ